MCTSSHVFVHLVDHEHSSLQGLQLGGTTWFPIPIPRVTGRPRTSGCGFEYLPHAAGTRVVLLSFSSLIFFTSHGDVVRHSSAAMLTVGRIWGLSSMVRRPIRRVVAVPHDRHHYLVTIELPVQEGCTCSDVRAMYDICATAESRFLVAIANVAP